jgi:lysyl endopeptidase
MSLRIPSRLAAAAIALLAAVSAPAQSPLQVPGERAVAPKAAVQPELRLAPSAPKAASIRLPDVTAEEVERVRQANRDSGMKGPRAVKRRVVVGLAREARIAAMTSAGDIEWTEVAGGHAAQVAVTSPDAGSLRLAIGLAGVPLDVEMVFYGSGLPGRLEGPVKVGDVADRTRAWWSPLTEGETQVVEFFVPAHHDAASLPLRILDASHVFTTPSSRFTKRVQDIGRAESCNVDVPCSSLNSSTPFREVVDSVAQMVFVEGGFTVLCTGTLLADSDGGSQTPWFYSANHCFENIEPPYKTQVEMQAVANSLSTIWFFQAASCGSSTPASNWRQVGGGATLLFNHPQTDVLFLRLNTAPPAGAFFSGWDATPVGGGTSAISIHHPQGDLKKATQGTILGFGVPQVAGGFASYIETRWAQGSTDVGSSGGGLWTSSGGQYLFRGGLWGGTAFCSQPQGTDFFSRLDQAYPALAPYLAASAAPAFNVTDLWWNPGESGWGLNLIQHPSRIVFGVWYTYGADGKRTWFVMPNGSWTNSTTYTGPLFQTAGPPYSTATFDPARVQSRQVGTATLTFSNASNGTFAYSVDGVQGAKSITRQPY